MDKNLTIAFILTATDKASRVFSQAFERAESHAKSLEKTSRVFNDVGDKALIAGGAATAFFGETIEQARESAKAARILEASFNNLGNKGKEIAKQGKEFAEAWQVKIGITDEDIEAVESKFAPFQQMFTEGAQQAQIFQRATKLAFDMQAMGYGEAAMNAVKLGKFANDPISNMNAMSKVLGKVTPQVQKHIESLVLQHKFTEAQSYALGLLEKKFNRNGSVAEAAADQGDKFKVSLHKLSVELGTQLLPKINALLNRFLNYLPTIEAFIKEHKGLIMWLAKAGVALLGFGAAMKVVGFTMSSAATAFKLYGMVMKTGKLITGIVSFGAHALETGGKIGKLVADGQKFYTFITSTLIPGIATLSTSIVEFGAVLWASPITWYVVAAVALAAVAYLIYRNWDKIKKFFTDLWNGPLNSDKIQLAVAAFLPIVGIPIIIIKHWGKIKGFFENIGTGIKNAFNNMLDFVEALPHRFFEAGKNIIKSIGKGMVSAIAYPVRVIASLAKRVRGFLPFSPAKEGPLRDIHRVKIMETIASSMTAKPLINAMNNALGGFTNHAGRSPISQNSSNSSMSHVVFAPVINLHGSATMDDAHKVSAEMRAQFKKLMREYSSNQSRTEF